MISRQKGQEDQPSPQFPSNDEGRAFLLDLASRYIWWKTPEEAMRFPDRVMAQVMDIGDFDDVKSLVDRAGEAILKQVLLRAQAGWFRPRSWHYWHYRLGLADLGEVPPLPKRNIP